MATAFLRAQTLELLQDLFLHRATKSNTTGQIFLQREELQSKTPDFLKSKNESALNHLNR